MGRRMTLDQALDEGAKIGVAACRRSKLIDRDDARQIGRIAAWDAWRKYDGVRDFRRWLTTCVYWRVRRELRARRKQQSRPRSEFDISSVSRETEDLEYVDFERLRLEISALPDVLRRCVELRFFRQYTLIRIAETMRIPISTVQLRLTSALDILRDRLR